MRTGQQYVKALADGRAVYLDGARVADVTRDAAFQGIVQTIASLYDTARDPSNGRSPD